VFLKFGQSEIKVEQVTPKSKKLYDLSSICDMKQHPSSSWKPTKLRFSSPHFFVGKLPTNATLKFDDTALCICTSGSIVSEGRFAIEIPYTNVGLQKNHPHKKEKLTTYYSIKKRNGQTLAVIISPATLLARGYN
jgi:hypothetical protein